MNCQPVHLGEITAAIPADFRATYVRLGLKGCAEHYGRWNRTIRRWCEILGREALQAERARWLAEQAAARAARQSRSAAARRRIAMAERRRRAAVSDVPPPPVEIVRAAAHYLRHPRNGGFMVSPTEFGDWFVGSVRTTPHDVVARAVARGFSPNEVRI